MKKHLITGGSGFIGSALVKRLVEEGHSVRVLDSNIRGVESRLNSVANDIDFCTQTHLYIKIYTIWHITFSLSNT